MLKKIAIGSLVVIIVAMVGGFLWVRSVLAGDGVRLALAAQASKFIGQPVTIGRISATAYPRVTVTLGDVRIGEPSRVQVGELRVGTDFRALLSRRIEHASLRLSGARIELPLPPPKTAPLSEIAPADTASGTQPTGSSPVELVSIDEIVFSDVQIVSNGRTLRGDVEVVPQGNGLLIRKIALGADGTTITATGQITDLSGPAGEISLKAGALNVDQLMAFVSDFSIGAGLAAGPEPLQSDPRTPTPPLAGAGAISGMNLALSLEADRATMGTLALEKVAGKARITAAGITLEPIAFGVFGGRYEGSLTLVPERDTMSFRVGASLSGVDMAAVTSFAGSPGTISGKMSGRLDLSGRGSDPASVINNARGTARIDITDGVVKNLGLVHGIVVATSMRSGATKELSRGSKDEPFSKLGATLTIANGAVSTDDLTFESKDLSLAAQGSVHLSASTVNLRGRVQLSEALSKQAGADLARYTQEQGRVTLPATIAGAIEAPKVSIDVGDMAKRAIRNAANEQAKKLLSGTGVPSQGLGGLFRR